MTYPRYARLLFACLVAVLLCTICVNVYRRNHRVYHVDRSAAIEQLNSAAMAGDTSSIDRLLHSGVNMNAITGLHSSVLSSALMFNRFKAAKLLIDSGANVRASALGTWPPLVDAAAFCPQAVPLLLEKGADVNAANNRGETPLLAALDNRCEIDTITLLLAHGADVNAKTNDGETVLTRAVTARDMPLAINVSRSGADARAGTRGNSSAQTELMMHTMANLLTSRVTNVNPHTKHGSTPLASAWKLLAVRTLLAHGADCNAKNGYGETPLMLTDSPTVVRMLKQYGADINSRDNAGHTALFYAFSRNDRPCALALLDAGAEPSIRLESGRTVLQEVVSQGTIELVKAVLKRGVDVNQKGEFNETPLQTAIKRKRSDIARLLKQAGAKE